MSKKVKEKIVRKGNCSIVIDEKIWIAKFRTGIIEILFECIDLSKISKHFSKLLKNPPMLPKHTRPIALGRYISKEYSREKLWGSFVKTYEGKEYFIIDIAGFGMWIKPDNFKKMTELFTEAAEYYEKMRKIKKNRD